MTAKIRAEGYSGGWVRVHDGGSGWMQFGCRDVAGAEAAVRAINRAIEAAEQAAWARGMEEAAKAVCSVCERPDLFEAVPTRGRLHRCDYFYHQGAGENRGSYLCKGSPIRARIAEREKDATDAK